MRKKMMKKEVSDSKARGKGAEVKPAMTAKAGLLPKTGRGLAHMGKKKKAR